MDSCSAAKWSRSLYKRYRIQTNPASDIRPMPSRFHVDVKRQRLAELLLKELVHFGGNWTVVASRPCMYGVLSGPVGGFAPDERLCVGCLRCTTEFPEIIQIYDNVKRKTLGDSFFTPDNVETVCYEARTGQIPVKGAGYRGWFGGDGWDGMWTDMSEIVRPTRDGIHGREFISTTVDIGPRPTHLLFEKSGKLVEKPLMPIAIPIPILFDVPAASLLATPLLASVFVKAAEMTETLCIIPARLISKWAISNKNVVPLFSTGDDNLIESLNINPVLIEIAGVDENFYAAVKAHYPGSVICQRMEFPYSCQELVRLVKTGRNVIHLVANYHGEVRQCDSAGQVPRDLSCAEVPRRRFMGDMIREAHLSLVKAGCRDEATLLGSGGIIAAEHVAKAIICGLDAVALDTVLLAAVQAQFSGECLDSQTAHFKLPRELSADWGAQRIANLISSWYDQMLEILGAMGLREIRRLRGEAGRAMFQKELEHEAFAGIKGYER